MNPFTSNPIYVRTDKLNNPTKMTQKSLDIIIPVLNEERALPQSIPVLHAHLAANFDDYDWRIVIADNGSEDATPEVSQQLSQEYPGVSPFRLEQRGRGLALRTAWLASEADIVAYMDVDLSTDLAALHPLVGAIADHDCDIAIGSRLIKGALVERRPLKREITSRGYSLLFRGMFFTGFRDAQCGFKAVSRRAVDALVPLIKNNRWFFDTELLILAEANGFKIREIPVHWTDDPDTRVKILGTAIEDVKGLLRLRFGGIPKT